MTNWSSNKRGMFLNLLKEKLTHFYKLEGGQPELYQCIYITFKGMLQLKLGLSVLPGGKAPLGLFDERQA